jgi:UDP-N-acetylglucosamine transferase subunit ALG13
VASLDVVVTLGTIRPYRFARAVDWTEPALRPGDTVLWQLGATEAAPAVGEVRSTVPADELASRFAAADVVITHGGVGTIFELLEAGKHPVVICRRGDRGEHVDDHQLEAARALAEHGLVTVATGPLTREDLVRAARRATVRSSDIIGRPARPGPR